MIPSNPSDRVELPKKKKYQGAKVFTSDQLQELLDLFHDAPLETAVHLAVSYGMHRSEICGLKCEAVDFDAGTLYVCHTAVKNGGRDYLFGQYQDGHQPAPSSSYGYNADLSFFRGS